ncbi:hypothetical protein PAECIP111893_03067 [Paenibacillus plantiphilus]|uniref:Uncharacterized protein n=1 Tax=Paenibacillus plantiphilus TaxID=2905650 RepID=A0ABN8GKC4_9BACL|nr:hypothetical protein [Paenibacillus plantiphilus]CAH1209588.1 hypothetical protein PAECIP111893_03067 [Paenibacillus plantiphilus]
MAIMRKQAALGLMLVLLAGLLATCASNNNGASTSGNSDKDANKSTGETASPADLKEVTLKIFPRR